MDVLRMLRHLCWTPGRLRRAFTPAVRQAIAQAVQATEQAIDGQIRFAVEGALPPAPLWRRLAPRERAIDVFSRLRVWDTEYNNGVLIYVLLADHAVEIVADRGIHNRVDATVWSDVCRRVEADFSRGAFEAGAVAAIAAVGDALGRHFPRRPHAANELSDEAELLD